ncbi:PaaX family transcriptional regulator C-terminal domain-containing protein [Nocardioides sp. R-C-SC26]|uniref:PaaX family transcriptional regulator C-terminal domain-containing protein n=1 Tax=Nocardioides sp. R-C-SC26 TaxID=2870414 RepID=UPI001E2DC847|nr:PaaX family transcriptional regulator C-terminal domain-containing protein [Nocardioides sp. R-C-SC26]
MTTHEREGDLDGLDELVRPLTNRSIILSVLLGYERPTLSARELVRVGASFGVGEGAVRVVLSRMLASGDLERSDDGYALAPRLRERQRLQDASLQPAVSPWDGGWDVVVLPAATDRAERARRRRDLDDARMGELREGVWLRPDNLVSTLSAETEATCVRLRGAVYDEAGAMASRLWDLSAWDRTARALGERLDAEQSPADQMAVAAAIVRHLRRDPLLPEELLPAGWVGAELRGAYADYRTALVARHVPDPVGTGS